MRLFSAFSRSYSDIYLWCCLFIFCFTFMMLRLFRVVPRYLNSWTCWKILSPTRRLVWSPTPRSTIMYLVFSLLFSKLIPFPVFINSETVLWIYTWYFPIITMSSAYANKMFPSSRFNVSIRGIYLITLSSAILKKGSDNASPCFNPFTIIDEDETSLFILIRLLVFVLHSCIMLINLV